MATDPIPQTTSKRRLKVYGGSLDGRHRVIMAARSFREFRAATGIGPDYGGETWNAEEVAQAMTAPGTAFARRHHAPDGAPWSEWRRTDA